MTKVDLKDPAALDALAESLLTAARRAGADAADAVAAAGESLSVTARGGALEEAQRDETVDFGLRVLIDAADGPRQACVSASDPRPEVIQELADRAVAMARETPPDPDLGLAAAEQLIKDIPDLGLSDAALAEAPDALLNSAIALEAAARGVAGVRQAEDASAGWRQGRVAMAATNGFAGAYDTGSCYLSVSALAGGSEDDTLGMERDYAFAMRRRRADLPAIETIGHEAGERVVKRLHPKKPPTGPAPVIFERRVAGGLIGGLLGALNGRAIVRRSSFLQDAMGERILPEGVDLIDDATLPAGLSSRPFDGDGLPTRRKALVENGLLTAWLLDLAAAKRLGLSSNGSASRGLSGPPSPSSSNAWITPGAETPDALIAGVQRGLLVTERMGRGLNPVTGDYSTGAAGFWIENGEIAHPVSEITIAGDMREMLASLRAADDLVFERGVNAPTLRVDGMTVASG